MIVTTAITSFTGEHRFLSNFCRVCISYEGLWYASVEAAYQSSKALDPSVREEFVHMTPIEAKRYGRKILIRKDWENVKIPIMAALLHRKFLVPDLRAALMSTGDAELVEGNWWHDTFWGVCEGEGQNWLGKLLMNERTRIAGRQGVPV